MGSTDSSDIFVGIDAGGSRTRAVIARRDGQTCGYGEAGPANPNDVGREGARQSLIEALRSAAQQLGTSSVPLSGVFIGLAGAASYPETPLLAKTLARDFGLNSEDALEIDHDLRIALAGAISGPEGIVVVAGTGSAAYGRNAAGGAERIGGWGPLLDDVGSGYWLGLEALQRTTRALDGRRAHSELTRRIANMTHSTSPSELLRWIQEHGALRPAIAALAPQVFHAWAQGDDDAAELALSGAEHLARLAAVVQERLFPARKAPVALAGGLGAVARYARAFAERIAAIAPGLTVTDEEFSPLVGAWRLAASASGRRPEPSALPAIHSFLEKAKKSA